MLPVRRMEELARTKPELARIRPEAVREGGPEAVCNIPEVVREEAVCGEVGRELDVALA